MTEPPRVSRVQHRTIAVEELEIFIASPGHMMRPRYCYCCCVACPPRRTCSGI